MNLLRKYKLDRLLLLQENKNQSYWKNIALIFLTSLIFCACARYEDLVILDEGPEFPTAPEVILNKRLPIIQPNDVLYITVEADDPEGLAAEPFNKSLGNNLGGGGGNLIELSGYLVDTAGYIEFPILGELKVGGRTTDECKTIIKNELLTYIKNPVVNIRFLNFRINLIGEVSSPGAYSTTNERLTIFEALSQAGGITPVGNSTNILIIREKEGKREYGRINLKSRDVFQSPYFYLQQNDVLYVEPLETKIAVVRDPALRILPWVSFVSSSLAFLIAVFRN